jgi:hypothetical protein
MCYNYLAVIDSIAKILLYLVHFNIGARGNVVVKALRY